MKKCFKYRLRQLVLVCLACSLINIIVSARIKAPGASRFTENSNDSLTLADVRYLRQLSLVIRNLEDSLHLDSAGFASRVELYNGNADVLPDTSDAVIAIPNAAQLPDLAFGYVRALSNAGNATETRLLIANARSGSITKISFADGLASIESKAIFNQILAALEMGTVAQLRLPARVINAGIDHLHGKINAKTALYMMFDYVKKTAVDSNKIAVYKQFLDYYTQIAPPVAIPKPVRKS